MRTKFRIRSPYAEIFQKCTDNFVCRSPARPERFIEKMKKNTGMAGGFFGITDDDGLERRNPLIVALGDSVTAGHFENVETSEGDAFMERIFQDMQSGTPQQEIVERIEKRGGLPVTEVFDARESYIEKFRTMLIDKYEFTSVSVVNSGIAGDTLLSMIRRADRDVVRYDPDLILINASLNWDDIHMGDENVYKKMLKDLVQKLKRKTNADIILLTPNGDLPNTLLAAGKEEPPAPTTYRRAEKIREVAEEEQVCLADVRAVWEEAREKGCPWKELLANGINHPSVEGHEVYAKVLMKLFED